LAKLKQRRIWRDKQKFSFERWVNELDEKCGEIHNSHPEPSEEPAYRYKVFADHEIDYALISVLFSPENRQVIVGLAGLSTLGTEAAARFVTKEKQVAEIFARLGNEDLRSFEAVLSVEINVEEYFPTDRAIDVFNAPPE
jgi:hypothetical protein